LTSRNISQARSTEASTSILVLCSTGPPCSWSLLETDQDHLPFTSCLPKAPEVAVGRIEQRSVSSDRPSLSNYCLAIDGANVEKTVDAEAVTIEVFVQWLHARLPAAVGGLRSAALTARGMGVTGRLRRLQVVPASPVGRRLARTVVRPLPIPLADGLRRALATGAGTSPLTRVRRAALRGLYHGGIPRAVSSFRLIDNRDLEFVAIDSQVLEQLYWCGEQGWEPELLPWWRAFCRSSQSVLELGTNIGYFAVQGGRAAPGVRYVAVEPHPVSAQICWTHLNLNQVASVELIEAAAVADPAVSTVSLLVPEHQAATPTIAFLPVDTELPPEMARNVTAEHEVPAIDVRRLLDGVDLIKMDVEGQEHVLLAAMRQHLRGRRPTLFVEVLPGTVKLRALLAELCTAEGYRCYAATPRHLVELLPEQLPTVQLKDEFGSQDVILCAGDLPLP
jgi:FkbM family methyltransferase